MTLFVGLLAVALVVGQLDTVQHAALMTVYDALGALVDKRKKRRQMGEIERFGTHRTRSDVSLENPLGIVPVRLL